MRVLQRGENKYISGGVNVESAAKWGGRIGGVLGSMGGASFGFIYTIMLATNNFHPLISGPVLIPAGGLTGYTAGTLIGYSTCVVGATGYNVLSGLTSYVYS